jgi:hypothetical protein
VRLVGQSDVHWANRAHFLAIAAREMRASSSITPAGVALTKRGDRVVGSLDDL